MKDLVDDHRANIAKAGVTLAEEIAAATAKYSAAVAASEAALEVAMDRRLAVFNGAVKAEAPAPTAADLSTAGAIALSIVAQAAE